MPFWNAVGTFDTADSIRTITPNKPLAKPNAEFQFDSAVLAAVQVATLGLNGTGEFTVTLHGTGQSYPDSILDVQVSQEATTTPGADFYGHKLINGPKDIHALQVTVNPPTDTLAESIVNNAKEAAIQMMNSHSVGQAEGYMVTISGTTAAPRASVFIEIKRRTNGDLD